MEYEDRLVIATPEGVELELTLAGLGSRSIAGAIDTGIQLVLILAALVLAVGADAVGASLSLGSGLGLALFLTWTFLVFWGYDVLFEVWGGGKTPGKRMNGLRVVRSSGRPVGFRASAVRNLLRVVDGALGLYTIGAISILVTRRNQRLGDIAADTVVLRERRAVARRPRAAPAPAGAAAPVPAAADVSAVSLDELATVRSFLDRRPTLEAGARAHLARQLADRLRPRVGGAPPEQDPERFLEWLAAAKAARS